ncbi:MAG: response regulator [Armatimonadota bacterium]|nr:MAG: response regulator [Armatimonadota bacterium]
MQKRVLIVDDNPETVKLIGEGFATAGFSVCSANNGAECLRALASEDPDLVILDMYMPVLNGFETLRLLRESPETRNMPVIALSGSGEHRDVRSGWSAGADLYLTKPVRIGAVVAAAKWMLGMDHDGIPVPAGLVPSDL